MPTVKFNFEPDVRVNLDTRENEFVFRPYILVKLKHNRKTSQNYIRALLDTGVDYNTFPSAFAEELGINVAKGKKLRTTGVGGNTFDVYAHLITLQVEGREFETVMYFGKEVTIPLLGREGLFNYFDKVTFRVRKREFDLKF